MMLSDFQTTTHGKWILAGEHAVLRGSSALVFPIMDMQFQLDYFATAHSVSLDILGSERGNLEASFWSALKEGCRLLKHSFQKMQGNFSICNNIPIGLGLGTSAALCVTIARWFAFQNLLPKTDINLLAKTLENVFHGQSSGLDIAGVSATSGIYFKQEEVLSLSMAWQPRWYLSSCQQIGQTFHCIQKVQNFWKTDPVSAQKIDQDMHASVEQARAALENAFPDSLFSLAEAIQRATDCFNQWGLIGEALQRHMHGLREAGALAVKPTGSGGGGYVLSLWAHDPPPLDVQLITLK